MQGKEYQINIYHPKEDDLSVNVDIHWQLEKDPDSHSETRRFPSVQQMSQAITREKIFRGLETVGGLITSAIIGTAGFLPLIYHESASGRIGNQDATILLMAAYEVFCISGAVSGFVAAQDGWQQFDKLSAISRSFQGSAVRIASPVIES